MNKPNRKKVERRVIRKWVNWQWITDGSSEQYLYDDEESCRAISGEFDDVVKVEIRVIPTVKKSK